MKELGKHYLLECIGCPGELLNNVEFVKNSLLDAAKVAQAHIIDHSFNQFNPYGISGFVVIAESHISIHTWPEYGYAAVDVFTCGGEALPEKASEYIVKIFKCEKWEQHIITRGLINDDNKKEVIPYKYKTKVAKNVYKSKTMAL